MPQRNFLRWNLSLGLWLVSTVGTAGKLSLHLHEFSWRQVHVSGSLSYDQVTEPLCFKVPYRDPAYFGKGVYRGLFESSDSLKATSEDYGHTEISTSSKSQWLTESVIKIYPNETGQITMSFRSTPKFRSPKVQIISGYHPVAMEGCKRIKRDETLQYEMKNHTSFQFASPFRERVPVTTHEISLVQFQKPMKTDEGQDTLFIYESPQILGLRDTILQAKASFSSWFRPFPYGRLIVVETYEQESTTVPGVIFIQTPKQPFFAKLQNEYLNWSHWTAVSNLARQWWGTSIQAPTKDEDWLVWGISDFAVNKFLSTGGARNNLFNDFEIGFNLIQMKYYQMQDLAAALQRRKGPNKLRGGQDDGHVNYIKNAIAMRHLSLAFGRTAFERLLHRFSSPYRYVTPQDLLTLAGGNESPYSMEDKVRLTAQIHAWWQASGWPDFVIESIQSRPEATGYSHQITLRQLGDLTISTKVQVEEASGDLHMLDFHFDGPESSLSLLTRTPIERVEIDPERSFFDANRFNNSTDGPGIQFVPGTGNRFADDEYTLFWLPYPFKRPGEMWSLGVQGALFRYVDSSVQFKFEHELGSRNHGYLVAWAWALPERALTGSLQAEQNFKSHRLASATVTSSRRIAGQGLSLGLKALERRIVGVADSSRLGLAPFIQLDVTWEPCELEHQQQREWGLNDKPYIRHTASIVLSCFPESPYQVKQRLFTGRLRGPASQTTRFYPEDLMEAHLRLDSSQDQPATQVASSSTDFFAPLALPSLDGAYILNRHAKWRIFYDYGESRLPDQVMSAAGLGMTLPLGGHIMGAGSMAVTELAILTVVYSRVGLEINHTPSILFDISGQL